MQKDSVRSGVDRSALRLTDWDQHMATHDEKSRAHWLAQPIAARLAAALRCRRRVDGPLPRLDRSRLRLIDLGDING